MSSIRREIPAEQLDRQRMFMEKVRERSETLSEKPLAFVDTYGCQQNEADSERIRGMLDKMGYGFTDSEKEADIIVINTCAVRDHAEKRVLGNIGALTHTKRAKPDQIIALCGCMAQRPEMAEKLRRSFRHVDLVFGPHVLWQFPEFIYRLQKEGGRIFSVEDSPGAIAEGIPSLRDGGCKAWLSIMYGCNNFCSYCIVPYVRGRERSRRPDIIVNEAKDLIASGVKDITLLGQNVNSYGKDLDEHIDFSDIISRVNELDGDFLIRFMTSHPKDASEKLFRTIADCEKAAKHIHLPFQSGNDLILKRMNRHYTQAQYLELVDMARSYIPDIVLTSDVIVGFPGETDEQFADTLDLVSKVRFDALFTFIFSKREGTPAAIMEDPFTKEEKQARFDKLIALQNSISAEKHESYVGSVQRVLVDGLSNDPLHPLNARTNGGRLVHLEGDSSAIGQFANAEITGSNTWALFGKMI